MAAHDHTETVGRARLSFATQQDIDDFHQMLDRFERGDISADEWRAFRLVRGTYGQRQTTDSHMLRAKLPQGVATAEQFRAVADVADRFSRGFAHITTRQNIQFHFVKVHDAELAMDRLAEAGMTTREACGNSVRNITACVYGGVSASEAFDVTPYSEAMTRYFLRHPLSSSLPRKFKIAFEGCAEDHIKAAINDIGWIGRVQNGRRGFRVLTGGGTSTMATSATVLFDFLPVEEMFNVAEAIVRVFHALGDYKHKARNRMKFLVKSLGWDKWHAEFEAAYADVRAGGGVPLPAELLHHPGEQPPDWPRPTPASVERVAEQVLASEVHGPGILPSPTPVLGGGEAAYVKWAVSNLRQQKQSGYVCAIVTIPLGDLTSQQFRVLADLADAYSDGTLRVTLTQNVVFRWVRREEAPALYARLAAAGLGWGDADTIADVTSCPGAESCKLAVTQSRGLGRHLTDYIRENPSLIDVAPSLDLKVSGCPNGCGQHHIAAVGFQGSLRKVDGRAVPQYFVLVGGGVTADGATFGRLMAKIPARRAPIAVDRLAHLYQAERRDGESASMFFNRVDAVQVKKLLADLEPLTAETAAPEDFIDLAETTQFTPETTEGECAS
jgi:sulfite reductase (NADPH) hemoprotein beta-component